VTEAMVERHFAPLGPTISLPPVAELHGFNR
jgi:hypothetical protein